MKDVFYFVFGFLVWGLLIAGVCAIVTWGESPATWSQDGRFLVSFLMVIVGSVAGLLTVAVKRGIL